MLLLPPFPRAHKAYETVGSSTSRRRTRKLRSRRRRMRLFVERPHTRARPYRLRVVRIRTVVRDIPPLDQYGNFLTITVSSPQPPRMPKKAKAAKAAPAGMAVSERLTGVVIMIYESDYDRADQPIDPLSNSSLELPNLPLHPVRPLHPRCLLQLQELLELYRNQQPEGQDEHHLPRHRRHPLLLLPNPPNRCIKPCTHLRAKKAR